MTSSQRRGGNRALAAALRQAAQGLMRRNREPFGCWANRLAKRQTKCGWKKGVTALARRLACALYFVHLRNERFSYEQYAIAQTPPVPCVPLEAMGLEKRYLLALTKLGFTNSREVVAAYQTTLSAEKGIGTKCLTAIYQWIQTVPEARHLQPPPSD